MPSVVYSTRLWAAVIGPEGLNFTAPGGVVTVLRDITVAGSTDALPVQVAVSLTSPVNCTLLEFYFLEDATPPWTQWQGRIVLNPGDTLHVASTALVDCQASGYELGLP